MSETSHSCQLRCDSISHLPKIFPDAKWTEKLKRRMKKLCLVSVDHPQAFLYLKSRAAVERESKRQVEHFSAFIIHPLSEFRKIFNIFICIAMFLLEILSAFTIGFFHDMEPSTLSQIYVTKLILISILLIEICLIFRTGFIIQETFEIVLDIEEIKSNYIKTNLIPDIIGCLPFSFIAVWIFDQTSIVVNEFILLAVILLSIFNVYRFNRLMFYFSSISSMLHLSEMSEILVILTLRSYYCWHWLSCVRLFIPNFLEKNPIEVYDVHLQVPTKSISQFHFNKVIDEFEYEAIENLILNDLSDIFANYTVLNKYTRTMMITMRIILQSGYANETSNSIYNMIMTIFIMFIGWIYSAYIFIVLFNFITSNQNAEIKYEKLQREVDAYCKFMKLSKELTRKIGRFLELKYREKYFHEAEIMNSIPERLRQDIKMNLCSNFILKVPLFRDMPIQVLERIANVLEFEIFFPDDVIIEVNGTGDFMFFISYGKVAIIHESGDLVTTIADGAHFGEIALIMRQNRRTVTVKALEICEIYKLSRSNFRKIIEPHPEILRQVERIAIERFKVTSGF